MPMQSDPDHSKAVRLMLRLLVILASIANAVGGVVLIAATAMHWWRVPIIVPFVCGLLLIQGAFTSCICTAISIVGENSRPLCSSRAKAFQRASGLVE